MSKPYARSLCVRLADNADTAVRAVAWLCPYGDFHVLADRCQEAHEALTGKVRQPPVEQRRHLWLIDAHEGRGRGLCQTSTLDCLTNVACKLRLRQLLFRFRQTHVGEDVPAALGHRNFGFSLFDHS